MNRRSFIQALGVLAATPALGKYLNLFKSGGVREGITQAVEAGASKGMDFFNLVIKKVVDEGTMVKEQDRFRTYTHPDRPDISVDVNVGTGDSAVYFDTDQGSKGFAEITSDIEMPKAGKELIEGEEVYKSMGPDGDYYKDIDEGEIRGGLTSLEEWIKMKRGYAGGGRVGMWMGGPLSAGKSTLREMLRHFSKGSSHGKSGAEMLKMVNPKQFSRHLEDPNLLFMKGSSKEGLMATDMVKDMVRTVEGERATVIDELLSAARNIRKADKSIEQYRMEMIEAMMAKGADRKMAENLAEMVSKMAEGAAGKSATPNITDAGLLELETIHKNLLTKGRPLNAAGGRVGMWKGGGIKVGKNIMNLLRNNKKINEAVDNIFGSGDYKMDAEMAAESLVELNPKVFGGKLYEDLDDGVRSEIYGAVLNPIMQNQAMMVQMKKLRQVLDNKQMLREWNPPEGRKPNASGGIIGLTNNPMTASSKAGVESLFERR